MADLDQERTIYQLRITLRGVRPPVWRVIQVSSDVTLPELHTIIQDAMGWESYHLYEFEAGGRRFLEQDPDLAFEAEDAARVTLREVAGGERSRLTYLYDFGDSWRHDLRVEKVLAPVPGRRYPLCLRGKGACPPEDCGGIWGYANFLEAIRDPDHPDHEDLLEWSGGSFDPERFDLDEVNERLGTGWVQG